MGFMGVSGLDLVYFLVIEPVQGKFAFHHLEASHTIE